MVWLTSENPCSRATSAAHCLDLAALHLDGGSAHAADQVVMVVFRAAAVHATRRCRCAGCRQVPRWPSTAACDRRWSGRCPRRGGAVRRAVPGRTGTRRSSPAAPRWPPAAGWTGLPGRCRSPGPVFGVLAGVGDGGHHDLGEVVVDEAVVHLAACAFTGHHARRLEDAQVLADQWLGHARARRRVRGRNARTRAVGARWRSGPARPAPAAGRLRCRAPDAAEGPERACRGAGVRRCPLRYRRLGRTGNRFHYEVRLHARSCMSTRPHALAGKSRSGTSLRC